MRFARKLAGAIVLTAAASLAAANDAHHPPAQGQSEGAAPSSRMDHGHMHEHMGLMKKDMAAIRSATDPAERQRLMEAHFQHMEAAMGRMHGMMSQSQPAPQGDGHAGQH